MAAEERGEIRPGEGATIVCPNCGESNPAGSRFCSNCGTALGQTVDAPVAAAPPVTRRESSSVPPTAPEWRMSDPGPLPDPPRRRRWLWITAGILGACVLICCLGGVWINTAGRDTFCAWATSAAEEQPGPVDDDNERALREFCQG